MQLSTLTAISPVDGRYYNAVQHLNDFFSEFGLMKYRVLVEIEYLLYLEKKKFFTLPAKAIKQLRNLSENFGTEEAQKIKHAKQFFGDTVEIRFETQFSNKRITNLIQEICK